MQGPYRPEIQPRRRHKKRHGRLMRFIRGYLMAVGALTTLYVLLRLIIFLLVEVAKFV